MQTQPQPETYSLASHRHPLAPEDREPMAKLREAGAAFKGQLGPEARDVFDQMMEMTPELPGVIYEEALVGNIPGWWCKPAEALEGAAILYLHGGGYVAGSARAYRHLAGQIAGRAKVAAFVADYRLAPENRFPAAVEDASAAYRGLAEEGFTALALTGDSAGGGLALAVLSLMVAEVRIGAAPHPRAAAVLSPMTDLSFTGESLETRAEADPFLTKDSLARAAESYLGGHDSRDPQASPLFGNMAGIPPIRIHVGEDEILLDDSRRYAERAASEGREVQLHIWEGMAHVFASSVGTLAASGMALDDLGAFLYLTLR